LLGILVLWIIVALRGGTGFSPRQKLWAIGVGLVGYGVSLGLQFAGTHLSTASNGALVTSATPAFVLVFAALILHEKITRRRLFALLVATLGVILVIDPRTAQLSSTLFLGNLYLIGAAITWALYSVLVRKFTLDLDVLPATMMFFWGGLLVSVPAGLIEYRTIGMGTITPWVILGVLYLGVVSTALAMFLWNKALATLEAGVASLTFFAQPLVGVSLGAILLGELLSFLFIAGGLMIAAGIWLAAR
jgi:drug/metabolite transporter (DMT)-like permease